MNTTKQKEYIKSLYVEQYGHTAEDRFDDWLSGFTSLDEAEDFLEFSQYERNVREEPINPILF